MGTTSSVPRCRSTESHDDHRPKTRGRAVAAVCLVAIGLLAGCSSTSVAMMTTSTTTTTSVTTTTASPSLVTVSGKAEMCGGRGPWDL
jgi:hypothetical protein